MIGKRNLNIKYSSYLYLMKYYRIALEIVLIYFTLVSLFTKFYLDLEVINFKTSAAIIH